MNLSSGGQSSNSRENTSFSCVSESFLCLLHLFLFFLGLVHFGLLFFVPLDHYFRCTLKARTECCWGLLRPFMRWRMSIIVTFMDMNFRLLVVAVSLHSNWADSLKQTLMQNSCSIRSRSKSNIHHCSFLTTDAITMNTVINWSVVQMMMTILM